jgi:hypothetical protein
MSESCATCFKSKAHLTCGICKSAICKSCTQFVEEEAFSFLSEVPEDLRHQTYCFQCFDNQVKPQLDTYNSDMQRAKQILIFTKKEAKITRLMKRLEAPFEVKDCAGEYEATMRLAFKAVQANFNVLIDFQLNHKKVRTGSYQKLVWNGSAIGVSIEPQKLPKERTRS